MRQPYPAIQRGEANHDQRGMGRVTRDHVSRAIAEYDRLGPEQFFAQHGFGPTPSALPKAAVKPAGRSD